MVTSAVVSVVAVIALVVSMAVWFLIGVWRRREGFALEGRKGMRRPCKVYTVPNELKKACDDGLFDMKIADLQTLVETRGTLARRYPQDTKILQELTDAQLALENYHKYPVCKFKFRENEVFQYAEGGAHPDLIVSDKLRNPEDWAFCFAKEEVNIEGLESSGAMSTNTRRYELRNEDGTLDTSGKYKRFAFKTFVGGDVNRGICNMYAAEYKHHITVTFPVLVYDEGWYFLDSNLTKSGTPDILSQFLKAKYTETAVWEGNNLKIIRKANPVTLRVLKLRRTPCGKDLQPMPGDIILEGRIGSPRGVVVDTISKGSIPVTGGDTNDKQRLKVQLLKELADLNQLMIKTKLERDDLLRKIDATLKKIKYYQEERKVHLYEHSGYKGWHVPLAMGMYNKRQLQYMGFKDEQLSSIRMPKGWAAVLYEHDNFAGNAITAYTDIWDFASIKIDKGDFMGNKLFKGLNFLKKSKNWNNRVSSIKVGRFVGGNFETSDPEEGEVLKLQSELVGQRDQVAQKIAELEAYAVQKTGLLSRIAMIQEKIRNWKQIYETNVIKTLEVEISDELKDMTSYDGRIYFHMMLL